MQPACSEGRCHSARLPDADIRLVTTASDNTPLKTRLVAKFLETVGRTDSPIGTGPKTSDWELKQAAWIEDYDLARYPGKIYDTKLHS